MIVNTDRELREKLGELQDLLSGYSLTDEEAEKAYREVEPVPLSDREILRLDGIAREFRDNENVIPDGAVERIPHSGPRLVDKKFAGIAVAVAASLTAMLLYVPLDHQIGPDPDMGADTASGNGDQVSALLEDKGGESVRVATKETPDDGSEPKVRVAVQSDGATMAATGIARTLAVFDDGTGPALYVGGNFTTAGGSSVFGVGRWDGAPIPICVATRSSLASKAKVVKHCVKGGDTLSHLALLYYSTTAPEAIKAIYMANQSHLPEGPHDLKINQEINLFVLKPVFFYKPDNVCRNIVRRKIEGPVICPHNATVT